jgi:predicted  nucleic acid-binding Zn-ribbon protein
MTTRDRDDIASVAGQLASLTQTVEKMAGQLSELREGAVSQQERSDTQQERIDLAARELAEVSERLQAAANALRQSI